jgi:hypothetical protein
MWAAGTEWKSVRTIFTPSGVPTVCGRDIALMILRENISASEAEPMAPRLERWVDSAELYSAIGYGNTAQDYDDGGFRRRRDGLLVQCSGDDCSSDHVDLSEWRGDHGICNGDSGGPAIDADGLVIGVTSRGPSGCDSPIYGGLYEWSPWISQVGALAAADGPYPAPAWIDESRLGEAVSLNRYDDASTTSCSQTMPGSGSSRSWGVAAAIALVLVSAALRRRLVARG